MTDPLPRSAFDEAMEVTEILNGPLSPRERIIAETAARTAWKAALREQIEHLLRVVGYPPATRDFDNKEGDKC